VLNISFYIFIQKIQVQNILNTVYTLRFFFSSKCSLFHNSNIFGSSFIHILYTGCAKHFILYIYSKNTGTEYFEHGIYSPFFLSLQNAVCFIILTYLVPLLFTFYIQSVLNISFYIFIQKIQVLNILNTVYTLRFFSLFKMQFVS